MKKNLKLICLIICLLIASIFAVAACDNCNEDICCDSYPSCDCNVGVCCDYYPDCDCNSQNGNGDKPREFAFTEGGFSYRHTHSPIIETHNGLTTSTNNATYYFVNMEHGDMIEFANYAEDLLDFLHSDSFPYAVLDLDNIIFKVSNHFRENTMMRADASTNSLYMFPRDIKTVGFINFTLQALLGETINYGLLHGLSVMIYEYFLLAI